MTGTIDPRSGERALLRWLLTALAIAADVAIVAAMLWRALAGRMTLSSAVLLASAGAAPAAVAGVMLRRTRWAVICSAVGSVGGWLSASFVLGMIGLGSGVIVERVVLCSVLGSGVVGALLGLWSLRRSPRAVDAVALAALAGFAVLAGGGFGCLAGSGGIVFSPVVLSGGVVVMIVWPVRRRGQALRRPTGLRTVHYALTGAFAALQLLVTPLLADRCWAGPTDLRMVPHTATQTQGWLLAWVVVTWLVLWLLAYPASAGDRSGWRSWVLIAAATWLTASAEGLMGLARLNDAGFHPAVIPGLIMILTATVILAVLAAVYLYTAAGIGRFCLFSVLYSLAILSGLCVAATTAWMRALSAR